MVAVHPGPARVADGLSIGATVEVSEDVVFGGALVGAFLAVVLLLALESVREAQSGSVLHAGRVAPLVAYCQLGGALLKESPN